MKLASQGVPGEDVSFNVHTGGKRAEWVGSEFSALEVRVATDWRAWNSAN